MAAVAPAIADELVTIIAAETGWMVTTSTPPANWQPFDDTIVRSWLAEYELTDFEKVRCTVMPATCEVIRLNRSQARQELYGIDIILQQKAETLLEQDVLAQQAEMLGRYFVTPLPETGAQWMGVDQSAIYERDSLREAQIFASVSRHTFSRFAAAYV